MNPETRETARKAITFFRHELGDHRVTGGSLPEANGLIIAVKAADRAEGPSGYDSQEPRHALNGNGSATATVAATSTAPQALQALLVVADRDADGLTLMDPMTDGARVGPVGDLVGHGTRRATLYWHESNIEQDGTLSEAYVLSVAASLIQSPAADTADAGTPTVPRSVEDEANDGLPDNTPPGTGHDSEKLESGQCTGREEGNPGAGSTGSAPDDNTPEIPRPNPAGPASLDRDPQATGDYDSYEPPADTGRADQPSQPVSLDPSYREPAGKGSGDQVAQHSPPQEAGPSGTGDGRSHPGLPESPAGEDLAEPGLDAFFASMDPGQEADTYSTTTPQQAPDPAVPEPQVPEPSESLAPESPAREQPAPEADGPGRPASYQPDPYQPPGDAQDPQHYQDSPQPSRDTAPGPRVATPEPQMVPDANRAPAFGPNADTGQLDHARQRPGLGDAPAGDGMPQTGLSGTYHDPALQSLQRPPMNAPATHQENPQTEAAQTEAPIGTEHGWSTPPRSANPQTHETHEEREDWLEQLATGKTQTPEQRAYLIGKQAAAKLSARLTLKKAPDPPPKLATIHPAPQPAIERIHEAARNAAYGPGIVVPMISKGGTGKTTVAIETAFAFGMMFGAQGNNTSARTGRVLLVDVNLTNPDLAHRLWVDGAGKLGMKQLVEGEHLSRVVNRTALPNVDALFLLGRGDNDKGMLPSVFGDQRAMESLISEIAWNGGYDVIVVDTANTLPAEEDNPASYALTMWAAIADARYLILQPEVASFRNASSFAASLGEALGERANAVPVLNSFPVQKVYEEAPITSQMAAKRRASLAAIKRLEEMPEYPVVGAVGPKGHPLQTPLIVPDYPEEVRGFAAEGRPLSMFSQTFANAYSRIALDALRRILDNR